MIEPIRWRANEARFVREWRRVQRSVRACQRQAKRAAPSRVYTSLPRGLR